MNCVGKDLDKLMGNYDNILLIGDFNSQMEVEKMKEFCESYNLENLIRDPTCYKNVLNPTSIDMILTNRANLFTNSCCIETGISDYHKMIITVLKVFHKKLKPIKIKYRNYKTFNIDYFNTVLNESLQKCEQADINYNEYKNIFMQSLNIHAPLKEKTVRGNNAPFMNKVLSKAFMKRSKLKNNYNKNPTVENNTIYKKHRNYCTNLLKRAKKDYYNTLDINIFKDSKKFWKSIRPLFSDKQKEFLKELILVEKDTVTSKENEVAEKMNNYFIDAVDSLGVVPYLDENDNNIYSRNKIDMIVSKYVNHPSILKIKEYINVKETFTFSKTTYNELQNKLLKLDPNKASVDNDIPTKILIASHMISKKYLTIIYNDSIENQIFPESLKQADVMPTHKKDERTKKENYRPISLLPVISKLYEREMYNQILTYVEKYLSPYLFGFRKGHSTEQCLNIMLERWKKALDQKRHVGAVLTDLSKAFDCINHELIIAKLEAYGFKREALTFVYSYLSNRKQRTKVKSSYSTWRDIKSGVPQGSILGPLLFNIFINDIFLFVIDTSITNYADDNTPYAIEESIDKLIATLEKETNILLNWFQINEMKANSDKCHLLIINSQDNTIKIGNENIIGSSSVKLLGITIDNKLNFNEHITKIYKKASQKLHALARIAKYMDSQKLRIIMKAFIESQFNYCPLIWMFHSRVLNNKLNRLHERALRIVYKNSHLTFEELLLQDKSFSIHHRNLQRLATEMFKIKNNIAPTLMQELFPTNENKYNLRNERPWQTFNVRTVGFGTETLLFRGKKTWQLLPEQIRNSNSLPEFKNKIKSWIPVGCTCRLCKTYVSNLGFIE